MASTFFYFDKVMLMENIEQEIITLLINAGEGGLKLSDICRRVYNAHCSLFSTIQLDDVTTCVKRDLTRLTRRNIVINTGLRGVYAINRNSDLFMQMQFVFSDDEDEQPESSSSEQDNSQQELSLF